MCIFHLCYIFNALSTSLVSLFQWPFLCTYTHLHEECTCAYRSGYRFFLRLSYLLVEKRKDDMVPFQYWYNPTAELWSMQFCISQWGACGSKTHFECLNQNNINQINENENVYMCFIRFFHFLISINCISLYVFDRAPWVLTMASFFVCEKRKATKANVHKLKEKRKLACKLKTWMGPYAHN